MIDWISQVIVPVLLASIAASGGWLLYIRNSKTDGATNADKLTNTAMEMVGLLEARVQTLETKNRELLGETEKTLEWRATILKKVQTLEADLAAERSTLAKMQQEIAALREERDRLLEDNTHLMRRINNLEASAPKLKRHKESNDGEEN